MKRRVYNVLIIGAGDIGAGYDSPDSPNYLTHAHAFSEHEGFNLLGFVEPNIDAAKSAALKWNTQYFLELEEAFKQGNNIDIVTIAVPDELHYSILKKIVKYYPKFVLAEKPLTLSLEEANEIVKLYKNIPAIVNFKRKFVPEIVKLKERIDNNYYGNFIFGTSYYGKGFYHNGSHLINLMFFLLGSDWNHAEMIDEIIDYKEEDPSYSLLIKNVNDGTFLIKAMNQNDFTVFEFDLFFEKGRVRITDLGSEIKEYSVEENTFFSGFKTLEKSKRYGTQLNNSLLSTANHIYDYLNGECELLCSLQDTYREMDFMNQIIKKIKYGKIGDIGRRLN